MAAATHARPMEPVSAFPCSRTRLANTEPSSEKSNGVFFSNGLSLSPTVQAIQAELQRGPVACMIQATPKLDAWMLPAAKGVFSESLASLNQTGMGWQ